MNELKIEISVAYKDNFGDVQEMRAEALTFESAEGELGKLERALGRAEVRHEIESEDNQE